MSNAMWAGFPIRRAKPATPERITDAILFRDPEYGAISLLKAPKGRLLTVDHNFMESDFEPMLAVFEKYRARENPVEGGAVQWSGFNDHPFAVYTSVVEALKRRGYGEDPLGSRFMLSVEEAVAREPDLPAETRKYQVRETVERAIRRHVDHAFSVVGTFGKLAISEVAFFPRPRTKDAMGRPLPFLRARALLATNERAGLIQKDLRETLAVVGKGLVRATVEGVADGKLAVEFAIAPTNEAIEAILSEEAPTFPQDKTVGSRMVEFYLRAALPESARKAIEQQARAASAALSVESSDGRRVRARIPSTLAIDAVTDRAFRERLAWLGGKLDMYEAEVSEVGPVEEMADAPCHTGEKKKDSEDKARSESRVLLQPDRGS